MDLELWWLWLWPAAAAPIRPLAWELPYAAGVALKKAKDKNKTKRKKKEKTNKQTNKQKKQANKTDKLEGKGSIENADKVELSIGGLHPADPQALCLLIFKIKERAQSQ